MPRTEGKGSIFVFEIYLEYTLNSTEMKNINSIYGLKTLIVDDTLIGRKIVHSFVNSWEMRNGQFASGQMAIGALLEAKASGDPYQMAIIDYNMPEMNGIELARNVRKYRELDDLCMILLSSVDYPDSLNEIQKAGFSAYLVKPISGSILLNSLQNAWNLFSTKENRIVTQYFKGESVISSDNQQTEVLNSPSSLKFLIVDDNEVNVILLSAILKKQNILPDEAKDGYEALEKAKKNNYDVIFMDIEMPELDGIECFSQMKKIEAYKNRKFFTIATTAHVLEGSEEKFLNLGFDFYLPKPVNLNRVKDLLGKIDLKKMN